jgi:type I restriction enzyme S subunit
MTADSITSRKTRLGEIADFVMGQAPPGAECNFSEIGTPFVKAGEFGEKRPIIREWTTRPLKRALVSDVLICVVGATSGKLNLGADCAIGRSVAAIRPRDGTFGEFLYYQLLPKVLELRQGASGSAQGVISKEMLASIPIILPSLEEQHRIVSKLDMLFDKTDRARDELAPIPRLVERYKRAILTAALRGDFTADWRRRNGDPPWNTLVGRDLFTWTSGKFLPKKSQRVGNVPVFGGNGITGFHDVSLLSRPTLVIGRVGAQCGNVYITGGPAWITDNAIYAADINDRVSLVFARLVFATANLNEKAGGSGQPYVNQDILNAVTFQLPPRPEQDLICTGIDTAFGHVDRLSTESDRASPLLDRFDQASLTKTFDEKLLFEKRGADRTLSDER